MTSSPDQQLRPSLHLSVPHISPFPSTYLSIFPLLLQTSLPPSILTFLRFFISLHFNLSFALSARALLNLPRPLAFICVSISPSLPQVRGRMQQSLEPFKSVTSDRLDETLGRSVDLSFQRAAVTLLTSLISLLTAHEHGQETGAGRVLLSVTSPAGADQQRGVQAARLHPELRRSGPTKSQRQ